MTLDLTTGELIADRTPRCPRCSRAEDERIQAEQDLRAVERDLRNARREVTRLKTELQKQRTEHADMRVAKGLFAYWVARCNKRASTVFGEKRQKAVLARLREHDAEYIARAIDGLAASTWHRENGKDDLELVCRDEVKLEGFYELAERVSAPTLVGPAWIREFGSTHVRAA